MIDHHILSRIARTLQGISLQDIPKNWWTKFSTWRDFQAHLRTGTLLSVHRVVEQIGSDFGRILDIDVSLEMIDDKWKYGNYDNRRYSRYVARLYGESKKKAPQKTKGDSSF